MRTKHEFYADMLRYEKDMNRQYNWSLLLLYGFMAVPLVILFMFPVKDHYNGMDYIGIAGAIGGLLLYWWVIRVLQRRVADKHGMACAHCHKAFVFKHVGFTGVCSQCGTQAFTE